MSKSTTARTATTPRPVTRQTRDARTTATRRTTPGVRPFQMPFETRNIQIILLGVLTVAAGYLMMYMSEPMGFVALTLSPIILCLGYLVIIPYGIVYGSRRKKAEPVAGSEAEATTV